jgi:hypothetical protein
MKTKALKANTPKRKRAASSRSLDRLVSSLIAQVPNTWLDHRLTGPERVINGPPYTCQDIENLCQRIRNDMETFS